jgi:ABC-type sugar transport system ATPase subunit
VIVVDQLSVTVGDFSLQEVSFSLLAGEYGILMGRTGSGKTTLLESLCGLKPIVSGRILINGEDVTGLKPGARAVQPLQSIRILYLQPVSTNGHHDTAARGLAQDRTQQRRPLGWHQAIHAPL